MTTITITQKVEKTVKYLQAECGVRYWEDATVNGEEDTEGKLIPCRKGEAWCPLIDLATGIIQDWPQGTNAKVHYKVCDEGAYKLLDAEKNVVVSIDGYVPEIMAPDGDSYGDYITMTIRENGQIEDWEIVFEEFERVSQ